MTRSGRRTPSSSSPACRCSSRGASGTATRPWSRTPRTPTSSTTTGVPDASYVAVDLDGSGAGHRLADPARGAGRLREGPLRAGPRRRHPGRRTPAAGARFERSGRASAADGLPDRGGEGRDPSSTSPTRPGSSSCPGPTTTWSSTLLPTPPSSLAETADGRRTAWTLDAGLPAALARLAVRHGFTLVHYSTDYVFDGTRDEHDEDEPLSPLGGLRPGEGRRRPGPASRAPALPPAYLMGDRRRSELRAHDGAPGGRGRHAGGGLRPDRPAHVRRRARARDAPPGRERGVVRHLPRDQRRSADVVGRRGP